MGSNREKGGVEVVNRVNFQGKRREEIVKGYINHTYPKNVIGKYLLENMSIQETKTLYTF